MSSPHPWQSLRLRLPSQCPFCRSWPVWRQPAGICADCLARFTPARPRCPRCALPLADAQAPCSGCARQASPLRACVAAVDYEYPWQAFVAQFKYHRHPALAPAMAQLMLRQPGCATLLELSDGIVAVPLSLPRLRERGYNQAGELARALAAQSGQRGKFLAGAVARPSSGPAQARMARRQRLKNPRSAFTITQPAAVAGRHMLVVDDVMTTGTTLYALAQALQAAGAASVSALVFARTAMQTAGAA